MHRPSEPESLRLDGDDPEVVCVCVCKTSVQAEAAQPSSNRVATDANLRLEGEG
jgi:hypothetical protein